MGDDNILAEKEFDISLDGQTHKVKASAMFLVHDVAPQERGIYILNFTLGGQHAETTQPDKTYYSREQDRQSSSLLVRDKSNHMRNARSKVGLILATESPFVDL